MVRLGPGAAASALDQPHVRPMDFTGRPMKGMVIIEPARLHGTALRDWVHAVGHARALPTQARGPARPASAGDTAEPPPIALGAQPG